MFKVGDFIKSDHPEIVEWARCSMFQIVEITGKSARMRVVTTSAKYRQRVGKIASTNNLSLYQVVRHIHNDIE